MNFPSGLQEADPQPPVTEPRHGDVGPVIGCVEEERVVRPSSEPDVDAVVGDRDVGRRFDEIAEQSAEIPTSEIPVRFPADCGRRRRIRAESGRAGASGGVPVEIRDVSRVCPWGGSVGRSGAPGRPAPRRRPSGRSGDVQGHRRVPVGQGGVECPPVGDREVVEV